MREKMRADDFDYLLPEELIASRPSTSRESSRMMIVDRENATVRSATFAEFTGFIREEDLVVLNDTRVVPARFFSDDGRIELLRLEEPEPMLWRCMVRPGRKMRKGRTVSVAGVAGRVEDILEEGERIIRFEEAIDIEEHGQLALPHYMERNPGEVDRERYQTVYARQPGAIAAPTAGLHFTTAMLKELPHTFLTLHVGAGTFQPVRTEHIADHKMHREHFHLSAASAEAINNCKRVVSVGTTVTRTLEHLAATCGKALPPGSGETDIFIYPGFEFRRTGALLTNFHLPKSTLFMLVCAFAGTELMREAYAKAINEKFRFYSYGDCMFII
ncbi:MAG: tRNA preQ1(34) S-adenosylmethionine ribosyltransferase-isomerase QueA [Verrucomicrobiales bacterium]|nr:tRNA preQ1(34) S-adenosylmethionine ribosyltransferase-isomerase QueA [Verrucomicrobiales bacterium]